jgi:RNA polymerase sigma factor (TIGR02999 family)
MTTNPLPDSDREVVDRLFAAAYEELRRLATAVRRGESSHTLTPTALVNEAWLKLSASPAVGRLSRPEFKRVAARAMRQVLVEAARRRTADKRGGGIPDVTFDEALAHPAASGEDMLQLHEALETLATISPRQAAMVEGRFFGGLEIPELAEWLGVSEATVLRDWRAARAWLAHALRAQG